MAELAQSDLMEDIGFLLSRTTIQFLRTTNAALEPFGMKARPYSVLALAADSPDGMAQRELAERLSLDPSQVVSLVDELVDKGLVTRCASLRDRRTKHVVATSRGKEVRRHAAALVAAGHLALLADLASDETDALRELLQRLVEPGARSTARKTA